MIGRWIAQVRDELLRFRDTATWSISGFVTAWREEKSLRQWVALNIFSWVVMPFWSFSRTEIAILVVLGGLVVILELVNSAVEATVDYISTERHPLAKKAKDTASAAVFSGAILWAGIWVLLALG